MGNVESQSGDYAPYGTERGHLSRKHLSRSLRVSANKQQQQQQQQQQPAAAVARSSRRGGGGGSGALTGKMGHRNSETSTRSSSTPSIPQSLADQGLPEPFNQADDALLLPHFGSPIWVDRVAMNLRPVSFHHELADPSAGLPPGGGGARGTPTRRGGGGGGGGGGTYVQKASVCATTTTTTATAGGGDTLRRREKKRSKSADMWREDSLELSLSDISQDHLTSTEEIVDGDASANRREDYTDCDDQSQSSPLGDDDVGGGGGERANSLDQLYSPKNTGAARHRRYTARDCGGRGGGEDKMVSTPEEEEAGGGSGYGAYTLPCRRSHCLSEGLRSQQTARNTSMHGRRAQTIQVRKAWGRSLGHAGGGAWPWLIKAN